MSGFGWDFGEGWGGSGFGSKMDESKVSQKGENSISRKNDSGYISNMVVTHVQLHICGL